MASRIIDTGLTRGYVPEWTGAQAVREVLQNWLDVRTKYGCGGRVYWRDGRASVRDDGPGLQLRHLLLGEGEDAIDKIGQYHEGLKLALLVLARDGRDVSIRVRDQEVRPRFAWSEVAQAERLVFVVDDGLPTIKGTKLAFPCDADEWRAANGYFVATYRNSGLPAMTWHGQALSTPGGSIWVNGSRRGNLQGALFSYHVSREVAGDIGNRDREVVDTSKFVGVANGVWHKSASQSAARRLLQAVREQESCWEVDNLRLYHYELPLARRPAWRRAARAVFGKRVVLSSGNGQADAEAEYRGFRVVQVGWRWSDFLQALGVKKARAAGDKLAAKSKRVPMSSLTDRERDNLRRALRLARKAFPADVVRAARVRVVDRIEDSDSGTQANGICSPDGRVSLARPILCSLWDTLTTLCHELAHARSCEGDCSSEFESELCSAIVRVLLS